MVAGVIVGAALTLISTRSGCDVRPTSSTTTNSIAAYAAAFGPYGSLPFSSGTKSTRCSGSVTGHGDDDEHDDGNASPRLKVPSASYWYKTPHALDASPHETLNPGGSVMDGDTSPPSGSVPWRENTTPRSESTPWSMLGAVVGVATGGRLCGSTTIVAV